MNPASLRVSYRPLRIGWCIEASNLDEFRNAVNISHIFWGGRFNPIIPCANRAFADALITAFNVDLLYNISGTPFVDQFIKEFPHLQWPDNLPNLFFDSISKKLPTLLDVMHPTRHLYSAHVDGRQSPSVDAVIYDWDQDDPIRYVLSATCGEYPPEELVGKNYRDLFQKALVATVARLPSDEAIPKDFCNCLTPNQLTSVELEPQTGSLTHWNLPGIYYGSVLDFDDLVNFWNLRACGVELFFYDKDHHKRFLTFINEYLKQLTEKLKHHYLSNPIHLWRKDYESSVDMSAFGVNLPLCTFSPETLNGMNLNPVVMGFNGKSVLGAVGEDGLGASVTFQLPEKPFFSDNDFFSQMVVVSISGPNIGTSMLTPPFIPQLNEYYSHNACYGFSKTRSEPGSLGIILRVTSDLVTIRALPFSEIISKIFEVFYIKASLSPAGLITARLINQMGGIQGCRVFKISGVRALIKKYLPTVSFERTAAITTIGNNDPTTHLPQFDLYKQLYIEQREKRELKPEDAFMYLLKKGVFRAGLKLSCPSCHLDFWVPLDDLKSDSKCIYCGDGFNILPQLRDRNWAYRRSGLFGRDDNQNGGIPVTATLQQLETYLRGRLLSYSVGIQLTSNSEIIEPCEIDFIALVSSFPNTGKPLELVISECKDAGGEITIDDVKKLCKVAQAIKASPCRVFILFSKCGQFTPDEIERCKEARTIIFEQDGKIIYSNNVIMLSERELEPDSIYERTKSDFQINEIPISLEDLAVNTQNIFFDPKLKMVQ